MSDAVPIIYDLTRLGVRVLRPTPNGIDRVDFALARHFVGQGSPQRTGMMVTATGRRLLSVDTAQRVVDRVAGHWGEAQEAGKDAVYTELAAWLGAEHRNEKSVRRIQSPRSLSLNGLVQNALARGQSLVRHAPQRAIYINASQFPLWIRGYFNWLSRRPDIRLVAFIHDLLPLEMPEFFPPDEFARHQRRIDNLARFGSAAIVSNEVVAQSLRRALSLRGRRDMPILASPLPAAPIFSMQTASDPKLHGQRYFVMCATIEPRKNHLLLLHVWRELVERQGAAAPTLVLVGARGWENENVIDLLERCSALRNHVVEVSGLSTPGLSELLTNACGLLMPSFAEGYGLPIIEALAAGVPVLASNIEVFRLSSAANMTNLSPIDGEGWLSAITRLAGLKPAERSTKANEAEGTAARMAYFRGLEEFISAL